MLKERVNQTDKNYHSQQIVILEKISKRISAMHKRKGNEIGNAEAGRARGANS